jgi:two-component system, response regulator / RNA-binding antiterminator
MTGVLAPDAFTVRTIALAGKHGGYANELAAALAWVGNDVLLPDLHPGSAGSELARTGAEVVIVVAAVDDDRAAALSLIGAARHEGHLPVVAAIEAGDAEWTSAAVAAGASVTLTDWTPEGLYGAVHAACERFADLRRLEEAFETRATIERAKGVLMESRGISADAAFGLLRDESRRSNRKVMEIADAVVSSHLLLGRRRRKKKGEAAAALPGLPAGRPDSGIIESVARAAPRRIRARSR